MNSETDIRCKKLKFHYSDVNSNCKSYNKSIKFCFDDILTAELGSIDRQKIIELKSLKLYITKLYQFLNFIIIKFK